MKTLNYNNIELTEENFEVHVLPTKLHYVKLDIGIELLVYGTIISNNEHWKNIYLWLNGDAIEQYHTALCLFEEIAEIRFATEKEKNHFANMLMPNLEKESGLGSLLYSHLMSNL